MASIRGGLQAQTYKLPQVAPYAPPATQPLNDGLQALEGIQHIKGVTEEYYQKVAALKSFMQDVHNNYGIDVRVPDASRPESIELNSIFRTALADILSQGNMLKNSHSMNMAREARGVQYAPGIDPTATPAAMLRPGGDFDERFLDTAVIERNNLTQTPSYDEREFDQKKAEAEKLRQSYRDKMRDDPANAFHYQRQLEAITDPAQRPFRPFAPYRDTYADRRAGKRERNAELALKAIINIKNGYAEGFQPSTKQAPSGELFEVNFDWQNVPYGKSGKLIQSVRRDPGSGKTEVLFNDGSVEDITKINVLTLAAGLGDRYGYSGEDLQSFIDKKDLEGSLGQVKEEWALPDAIPDPATGLSQRDQIRAKQKSARVSKQSLIDPIKAEIQNQLGTITKPLLWGTNDATVDLGKGRRATIGIHTDGTYSLKNPNDLFPPTMFTVKQGNKSVIDKTKIGQFQKMFEHQTLEKLVQNLIDNVNIEDFGAVYEALGLPVPPQFGGGTSEQAPASPQGNTTNDPLGIRK